MGIIHNVIGGTDLSAITLDSASKLLYGVTAYDKDENIITGEMPNRGAYIATGTPSGNNSVNVAIPEGYHDGNGYVIADGATAYSAGDSAGYNRGVSETKKGTAGTAQVLSGYTFTNDSSVNASGSMTNRGAWTGTGTPTGNNQINVPIPAGYHNGNGYVTCKGQTAYQAGVNATKITPISGVSFTWRTTAGQLISKSLSGYSYVILKVKNDAVPTYPQYSRHIYIGLPVTGEVVYTGWLATHDPGGGVLYVGNIVCTMHANNNGIYLDSYSISDSRAVYNTISFVALYGIK